MRRKTQLAKSADLIKRLHGDSAAERLLHRLHSVALVMDGRTASEAARIYGDSPRAVAYWVTQYKESGLAGLCEESRPGRPPRLNPSQEKRVEHFVRQAREQSQSVNAKMLSDYIKVACGVTFTIRQCWRILKAVREE